MVKTIYFIRGRLTGRVKIGVAVDPEARLRDLQAGSPDVLDLIATSYTMVSECVLTEALLHQRFAKYRIHGEWFAYSDEMRDWLLANANVYDVPYNALCRLPKARETRAEHVKANTLPTVPSDTV